MKLLEAYSNSCSVDIKNKPFIYCKYFPLPSNVKKYITIQTKSGMSAKDYDLFQEVIYILKPILDKEGIFILHIGQDSTPISGVVNLNNQTSLGQSCFLIRNSLLHISVDSWSVHYACAAETPCVSLYGPTSVENHSPYHFNPDKTIFIESHRNGNKPSFQREENPKTINFIKPESIAMESCKLLNLKYDYPFTSLYIGKHYHNKTVESCLDSVIDIRALNIPNIICRFDYNDNLGVLIEQTRVSKTSIITDKPIPFNILKQFRNNIIELIYEIKKDSNPKFCAELHELKIPFRLYTKMSKEDLDKIKFDYIDYSVIYPVDHIRPDILNNKDLTDLYIKGGKFIVSKNGIFNSYWAYKNNLPIPSFEAEPQKIIDKNLEYLWTDVDYSAFFEKKLDSENNQ